MSLQYSSRSATSGACDSLVEEIRVALVVLVVLVLRLSESVVGGNDILTWSFRRVHRLHWGYFVCAAKLHFRVFLMLRVVFFSVFHRVWIALWIQSLSDFVRNYVSVFPVLISHLIVVLRILGPTSSRLFLRVLTSEIACGQRWMIPR